VSDNPTDVCQCGHARARHSANSTHPCLACIKCDPKSGVGSPPHANERCGCPGFTPTNRCGLCTKPVEDGAQLCPPCAAIMPEPITATLWRPGDPE
jgi:hypothetical protein